MTQNPFRAAVLMIAITCLCSRVANATGGVATTGGAFIKGAAGDAAQREWIPLTDNNGLLTGWPKHSSIGLIALYAPNAEGDHLILRELTAADGSRSILITGPESLTGRT